MASIFDYDKTSNGSDFLSDLIGFGSHNKPVAGPTFTNDITNSVLNTPSSAIAGIGSGGSMGIGLDKYSGGGSWMDSLGEWTQGLRDKGILGGVNNNGQYQKGLMDYGLGAATGLANMYMGMKMYGLEKNKFNFQKDMANKNFNAQRGLINAELEDRQRRRNIEGGGTPVAEYMAKYGVK